MNRRLACVMSSVLSAWVIYGVYVFLALRQLSKHILACPLSSARPAIGRVEILGRVIPFWELALAGSILPVSLCAHMLYGAIRRRYRVKHDLCTECGHRITTWRGRCPGCGVRVGPDPPRVHVLRT
jgi:hypothetical protein